MALTFSVPENYGYAAIPVPSLHVHSTRASNDAISRKNSTNLTPIARLSPSPLA